MSIYDGRNIASPHEWHLHHVVNDPEFRMRIRPYLLREEPITDEILGHFVRDFGMTIEDVTGYLRGRLRARGPEDARAWLDGEAASEGASQAIMVAMDATEQDVIGAYREFAYMRDGIQGARNSRRRAPENYGLVYAVFRARSRGLTFRAIYDLYGRDELPGYSGSTSQYDSVEQLQRYYHRHRFRVDAE